MGYFICLICNEEIQFGYDNKVMHLSIFQFPKIKRDNSDFGELVCEDCKIVFDECNRKLPTIKKRLRRKTKKQKSLMHFMVQFESS